MSRARSCIELGDQLVAAFWSGGRAEDLEQAVVEYRAAISCCDDDDDDDDETRLSAELGIVDVLRIQANEGHASKQLLDEGIALAEETFRRATPNSDVHFRAALALAKLLTSRRGPGSSYLDDVPRAVDMLAEITTNHALQGEVLSQFLAAYATALVLKWDRTEEDALLKQCNAIIDRALLAYATDPIPDFLVLPLVTARIRRGVTALHVEDVDECIAVLEHALRQCSSYDPRECVYWDNLGFCYEKKWSVWGSPEGLDSCIASYDNARRHVSEHHPKSAMMQGNFADSLYMRFVSRSILRDLDDAITHIRLVLKTMDNADDTRNYYVNLLGRMLEAAYAQYGKLEYLDEAIELHSTNLVNAPPTRQYLYHESLAKTYVVRFNVHGRDADLDLAVSHLREGLAKCPTDRHRITTSRHLADALISRFEENSNPSDIEEAVILLRTSLGYNDPSKREHGLNQSLLGWALISVFLVDRDPDHLVRSLQAQEIALDVVPQEHVQRPLIHFRIGMASFHRAQHTRESASFYEAIVSFERALRGLHDAHSHRGMVMLKIGDAQLALREQEGEIRVFEAIATFRKTALDDLCLIPARFQGAIYWAKTAHMCGDLTVAIEGYRHAIGLLPQMAWLGFEDDVRMKQLATQTPGLSSDAAACAIAAGQLEFAVELLEQSRGILWNAGQELRADLGKLKDVAPELVRELSEVSAALQYRPFVTAKLKEEEKESERRRQHRLATRWTSLVQKARGTTGFENFLRPLPYAELSHAARHGPVVLLNTSHYRSDALIIPSSEEAVRVIPLLRLEHDRVLQAVQSLQHALGLVKDRRGVQFLDSTLVAILRHLWSTAGGVIYEALEPYLRSTRRVWWCPVGAVSLLPIHACGLFDGSPADMADLIVSSYTPTLTALLRCYDSPSPLSSSILDVLVVSQSNTPGYPPLLSVKEELDVLIQLFPSSGTFIDGSEATLSRVQNLLPTHKWLHVCSHGTQSPNAPLDCAVHLYDGPLTLKHFTQSSLPKAELAFLSACHSAHGAEDIPDEALHLAAGLIFAGFRGVIAAQWAIADKDAPRVAASFYTHLLRNTEQPTPEGAAEALYHSIQSLRRSLVPPFRWVPFVHVGV